MVCDRITGKNTPWFKPEKCEIGSFQKTAL